MLPDPAIVISTPSRQPLDQSTFLNVPFSPSGAWMQFNHSGDNRLIVSLIYAPISITMAYFVLFVNFNI